MSETIPVPIWLIVVMAALLLAREIAAGAAARARNRCGNSGQSPRRAMEALLESAVRRGRRRRDGVSRFDHHDPCANCGHKKTDHRGKTHQGACELCWGHGPPNPCPRYRRPAPGAASVQQENQKKPCSSK
jgi:hypothetical protein